MATPLVPSALVIGSMVPDLPYYVPLPVSFAFTHTLPGLASIDLAMASVCFSVWHLLLAPVSVALAPNAVRGRLAPELPSRWSDQVAGPRRVLIVAVSILIGALTHIVWDEFTHIGRWGPRHVTWLAQRHGELEGYRWAQYASGVIGLIVIAAAVVLWWRRTTATGHQRIRRLPAAVTGGVTSAIVAATLFGAALGLITARHRGESISRALYHAATLGGGIGLLIATLSAVWCTLLLHRDPTPRA